VADITYIRLRAEFLYSDLMPKLHAARQIQIDVQFVMGIGGDHKVTGLDRQQVVFSREAYTRL
jgi:hypothetical protein